jgi:hypothetical protein
MDIKPTTQKTIISTNDCVICAPTEAGAAYVKKVTHPPTQLESYKGVPDCSAPNMVPIELKSQVHFPPILTYGTSTTATTTINPSSMLFVTTSGAYVSSYCFLLLPGYGWVQPVNVAANSGVNPALVQVCPAAANNNGYNFANWNTDVASYRLTYKSTTFYLNATEFNDQGTVTTAKFRPNILGTIALSTLLRDLDKKSAQNLLDSLPHFVHEYAQKVAGTDAVKVGKLREAIQDVAGEIYIQVWEVSGPNGLIGTVPYSNTQMQYLSGILPTTSGAMLEFSPKAVTRLAREGAFVVQQPTDPVQNWTNIINATTYNTGQSATAPGLLVSMIRTNNYASGSFQWLPLENTLGNVNGVYTTLETQWSNLDWSMTLFEGLTIPSTVGTTLSSVPYITVKGYTGFEAQAAPQSSLLPFQDTLPMPDQQALQMAAGIFHSRPDSLPAEANDLGTIAATAIKFIPTAITWLKDLFGKKKPAAPIKPKQTKPKRKPKTKPAPNNDIAKLTKIVQTMAINQSRNNRPNYRRAPIPKTRFSEMPVMNKPYKK